MLKINTIESKSILNKSKIFDYCVNPYTGCQINCKYCYAQLFMRRYSGHKEPWGSFVDLKMNAPVILRKQLQRAKKGMVWISSVCDPYQPLEAEYELTRQCLRELLEKEFPVTIQTKSRLVLRDLDLLQAFEDVEVGFTITTDNEKISKAFEPGADSIHSRLEALQTIHDKGIKTFVFIGPILPGNPENLIRRLNGNVDRVFIDKMNYVNQVRAHYLKLGLEQESTDDFFTMHKDKIIWELKKFNIPFRALF